MGRPVGQTNMQPAAAASEQTAALAASSSYQQEAVSQPVDSRVVLRGVALLYESPGGNQVDGLPPVPTYRCRINRRPEMTANKHDKLNLKLKSD